MREPLFYLPLLGMLGAFSYVAQAACWLKRRETGNLAMARIGMAIREGARAYLFRQYTTVAVALSLVFFSLVLLARWRYVEIFTPWAFLSGGVFSALAAYIGMSVATRTGVRTAAAAQRSLNAALRVALTSGAVTGLVVVGLGLVHLTGWYLVLDQYYRYGELSERLSKIGATLLSSCMGASFFALFARVGGGIYTKAADVGADLVGKQEAGMVEDDPRNPAVIADNVGDNVGDVAGMSADLYESYVGALAAAASLAVPAGLGQEGFLLPLALAGVGVLGAVLGLNSVHVGEQADQHTLLKALRCGGYLSIGIVLVAAYPLVVAMLGLQYLGYYGAVACGLLAGGLLGLASEYYTSSAYPMTQRIVQAAETGHAGVVIHGLAVGMKSTLAPVTLVGATVILSYYLGGGEGSFAQGLYGVALAAVGMLSPLGMTLAADAYGPVADNAGGIVAMARLGEEVRRRTDALDALGNTTAATGKGYAIGSAALTALALLASFHERVQQLLPSLSRGTITIKIDFNLLHPPVLVGLFLGGMLPFVFSSAAIQAVGRTAGSIVAEVRRQFREIKGLMEGTARPDYGRCVDLCTRSALREMVPPAVLAVVAPVVVGLALGIGGLVGLLTGTTVTGFVLAVMMANAGGAWDNAKKYLEAEGENGKESLSHQAAVTGDTVGDPLKDTAGPSLNIMIKLVSMVALVLTGVVLRHSLIP